MATRSAGSAGSLRRRSYHDVALLAGVTWLLLTAGLLLLVQAESRRMFDDSLRERAEVVLAFSQHELEEMVAAGETPRTEEIEDAHAGNLLYQVWQPGGRLAFRSREAPQTPLSLASSGFYDLSFGGRPLRGYAAWNSAHTFQVQMAEAAQARQAFVLRTSLLTGLVMALALGIFLLRLRRRLGDAFATLDDTAAELAAAPPGHLATLSVQGKPEELLPMLAAFNEMAARVRRAMQHEQRFTSDAAHELKTPLASLKILLRNVERAAGDERQQALQRMHEVVDRASSLVDQLLALARYDRDPSAFDLGETVDLPALCASVLHELQPLARSREVSVGLQPSAPCPLTGNREALRVLVRNLLDNAVRYTPHGGQVALLLRAGDPDGGIALEVHDSGPGVPEAMRSRVFGRFVRGVRQEVPGTGLGLAIAERVAHLHGGRIELASSGLLGGALARAWLPTRARRPQ